jgi:tetratricopeptide (TPR) repeat protein
MEKGKEGRMERKSYLILMIFVLSYFYSFGQNNQVIYEAYASGNMKIWKQYIDNFRANTKEEKIQFLNYLYGYIAYCIGIDQDDEAKRYLTIGEKITDELEKQKFELATIYAYKSAFVGFRIALAPYKAPFLGGKSYSFAKQSVTFDPNCYLGYVQLGNIYFYKPGILGGSKGEALKYYLKALEILERKQEMLKNNWNYLNLLTNIIDTYYEEKNYVMAKQYCNKALTIEPNFNWVKNKLYPKVLAKLKGE